MLRMLPVQLITSTLHYFIKLINHEILVLLLQLNKSPPLTYNLPCGLNLGVIAKDMSVLSSAQ